MIIYGVMTETSIGHLYMAGMIPGMVLALMFAGYVIGYAMIWPESAPRVAEDRGSFRDKLRSFREVAPVAILIFVVLGSMYLGIVTPDRGGGPRLGREPRAGAPVRQSHLADAQPGLPARPCARRPWSC